MSTIMIGIYWKLSRHLPIFWGVFYVHEPRKGAYDKITVYVNSTDNLI